MAINTVVLNMVRRGKAGSDAVEETYIDRKTGEKKIRMVNPSLPVPNCFPMVPVLEKDGTESKDKDGNVVMVQAEIPESEKTLENLLSLYEDSPVLIFDRLVIPYHNAAMLKLEQAKQSGDVEPTEFTDWLQAHPDFIGLQFPGLEGDELAAKRKAFQTGITRGANASGLSVTFLLDARYAQLTK